MKGGGLKVVLLGKSGVVHLDVLKSLNVKYFDSLKVFLSSRQKYR